MLPFLRSGTETDPEDIDSPGSGSTGAVVPALLFALSVVLGTLWLLHMKPITPFSDYLVYHDLAAGLISQHQFGYPDPTANRLPGYPALLSLFMAVSRSGTWLNICNVLLQGLLTVLVFFFAARLTEKRSIGIIAGVLCAVNPTFVFFSPVLGSEHLFAPLIFGALLLMLSAQKDRPGRATWKTVIAGAILGAAVLTRGEGAFYLPVFLLIAARAGETWKQKLKLAGIITLVCASALTPWYLRNVHHLGRGVGLTTIAGLNFYYGHNPQRYGSFRLQGYPFDDLDEVALQKVAYQYAMYYLREDPTRLLSDVRKGTTRLYFEVANYAVHANLIQGGANVTYGSTPRKNYPTGSRGAVKRVYATMAILALLSFIFWRRHRGKVFTPLVLIVALNWFCSGVVFWGRPRYRYTSEIVFCILAAILLYGLSCLVAGVMQRMRERGEPEPDLE
jgi:4-amino-4-deoxy-L-arabinose transferase-like glycosyltransferase